jgi:glycosyltransferase involved in cell wall biosynthesis
MRINAMSAEVREPLVSIIIATFESDDLLLRTAINSALKQTYSKLEVLIVDDSPSDGLASLVCAYDDSRVKYHHNEKSLGVARNHWEAIKRSEGDIIAILNHDDWYMPEFVDTLVKEMVRFPSASLAFCDHFVVNSQGDVNIPESESFSRRYGRATLSQGLHQPFYELVAAQTIPMAMGCIFWKSALPSTLPRDAGPSYDFWLTYLLARGGGGACYVPHRLSAWRCHEGNLTSAGGLDWIEGSAKCWKAIAYDPAFFRQKHLAKRNASIRYATCAFKSWREGRNRECACFAFNSLLLGFNLKGLIALLILPVIPNLYMQALSQRLCVRSLQA